MPAFVGVIDTVAGLAIAAGADVLSRPAVSSRQAPSAVARPSQADPFLHLHRLRAGDPHRGVLRARRAAPVLQLQLVPGADRSRDRSTNVCGSRRPAPRWRFSGTADGTFGGTLGRMQAGLQSQFPGSSIAVVPAARTCPQAGNSRLSPLSSQESSRNSELRVKGSELVAGPWSHVEPPASVPAWIGCEGFEGLLAASHHEPSGDVTRMFVRGVAFPDSPMPGYAVIVDLPDITDRVRRNTGVRRAERCGTQAWTGTRRSRSRAVAGEGASVAGATPAAPQGQLGSVTLLDIAIGPAVSQARCSSTRD